MRLFTAVDLSDDVRNRLDTLIASLRPRADLRWSAASNLHITTKFLGEWPENRLEELQAALRNLPARSPIEIAIDGLGWFPNSHSPRIFWAAVQGGDSLAALARDTEESLARLGIPAEER